MKNYSFSDYVVRRTFNEAESGDPRESMRRLFRAIMEAIRERAEENPLCKLISSDQQLGSKFLMTVHGVLQKMHPEEIEHVGSSSQGFGMLLSRSFGVFMKENKKEIEHAMDKEKFGADQSFNSKDPQTKLLDLAKELDREVGGRGVYESVVKGMCERNPKRIYDWADNIRTTDQLREKILSWQQRGLLNWR